jgi:aquaporin Z
LRGRGEVDMQSAGRHWREYLIEAGALATFMVAACTYGTLLWNPASPIAHALPDGIGRRVVMGTLIAVTAMSLTYSPWGKRSGAHLNPAITLTFLRLGKVKPQDAAPYVIAQFIGGVTGVLIAKLVIGAALGAPEVRYVVTQPGPTGVLVAFSGELVISGLLMTVILNTAASSRWMRLTGVFAASLVATYIALESPLSGMSMNPARTFGSAFVANSWVALWIYFTAPPLGMLLAAQLYLRRRGARAVPCAKMVHATPCIFCGAVSSRAERA